MAVDPAALKARCARHLSGCKRPIAIIVVDAIANNPAGKIDKKALRAAHTTVAAGS